MLQLSMSMLCATVQEQVSSCCCQSAGWQVARLCNVSVVMWRCHISATISDTRHAELRQALARRNSLRAAWTLSNLTSVRAFRNVLPALLLILLASLWTALYVHVPRVREFGDATVAKAYHALPDGAQDTAQKIWHILLPDVVLNKVRQPSAARRAAAACIAAQRVMTSHTA